MLCVFVGLEGLTFVLDQNDGLARNFGVLKRKKIFYSGTWSYVDTISDGR